MSLKLGKIPWSLLSKLLSLLPSEDIDIVVGPSIGEDAAIIRFKDGFLVVHSDPITAASRKIGWLAVHVAANDIAVRGAKPKWFLPTVLLPENTSVDLAEEIFSDMARALRELDAIAVGGHTEITPSLKRPIISVTAIGYSPSRVILTRNAQPGDRVLVIGLIGGEGAAVLAWDFEENLTSKGVDRELIERAKSYLWKISVVGTALDIRDYVNSMHDPTEGGVLQGLREIALASGTSIVVELGKLVVDEAVATISRAVGVDPLKLLSSGSLIATVSEENLKDVITILESKKYPYTVCGYVKAGDPGKVIALENNKIAYTVENDIVDEIYKLWGNA